MKTNTIMHLCPRQAALDWLLALPEETTPQQAWDICHDPDWMLWLLGRAKRTSTENVVHATYNCMMPVRGQLPRSIQYGLYCALTAVQHVDVTIDSMILYEDCGMPEIQIAVLYFLNSVLKHQSTIAITNYATQILHHANLHRNAMSAIEFKLQCCQAIRDVFPNVPLEEQ